MSDADDPLAFGINLPSIRDRLKLLRYFLDVTDIESVAAAFAEGKGYPPMAYVSVASETAEPRSRSTGGYDQRVAVSVSVLFCESSLGLDGGRADRVDKTRRRIIRQLVGWTPDGALPGAFLTYQRYLSRSVGDGLVWGEALFGTSYRLAI